MIDPFGNYLCQKIFELISQDDICDISGKIREKIVLISHNQHGTRSVQKLVEITKCKNNIQKIGNVLRNDVINLAKVSIIYFYFVTLIFHFFLFINFYKNLIGCKWKSCNSKMFAILASRTKLFYLRTNNDEMCGTMLQ